MGRVRQVDPVIDAAGHRERGSRVVERGELPVGAANVSVRPTVEDVATDDHARVVDPGRRGDVARATRAS
jgi:hypothetical protein